tara:strand:+ start:547 stop:1425 length:879 start_codon:yes stop_codon:yes gene_type:complete
MLKLIKLIPSKVKGKLLKVINKIKDKFFEIPFIEKPLPKKLSIKKNHNYKADTYYRLHQKATNSKNIKVEQFIKKTKFLINNDWFNEVSLITQTCIKNGELNFNHGKILYSLLSEYIQNKSNSHNNNITVFETGSARGFSALCMSKAIIDQRISGKIITIDCISHNKKTYWNCISDLEGEKTRQELLYKWEKELSNIIFIQGWTNEILKKIGIKRINFAFLDAQHTKRAVLEEFNYINERQSSGDLIFFDDVTPNLFDGVCKAVMEIEKNYSYKIKYLPFDKNRGYAIATRI